MTDIYDLLEKIRQRPGLYIEAPAVSSLYMFLNGYQYARQEQNLPLTKQERSFEAFQGWVQERFKVTAAVSWAKIILLHAADERSGFDLFFELLTQFREEKAAEADEPVQSVAVS